MLKISFFCNLQKSKGLMILRSKIIYIGLSLVLLLHVNTVLNAQASEKILEQKLDSLVNYKNHSGVDSIYYSKLNAFEQELIAYEKKNKPTSIYLICKANFAKDLADKNYHKAINMLQEIILQCKQNNFTRAEAISSHNLATIYFNNGATKLALNKFLFTSKTFKEIQDWQAYAWSLIDIGNVYYQINNYSIANNYYKESLTVFKNKCNNFDYQFGAAVCYLNFGLVAQKKANYQLAKKLFFKSLELRIATNQDVNISFTNFYIAKLFEQMQQKDSAQYYFSKALENDYKMQNNSVLVTILNHYAQFCLNQQNPDKSRQLYMQSFKIANNLDDKNLISITANSIASYFISIQKFDSTLKYAQLAYSASMLNENISNKQDALNNIIIALKQLKKMNELISYYDKLIELKDLMIANNEVKYGLNTELEKKEREHSALEEINKKQVLLNKIMLASLLLISIITALLIHNRIKLRKKSHELNTTLTKLQSANAHRNRSYSIIAHDLKGPVGSITALMDIILKKDLEKEQSRTMLEAIRKSMHETHDLLINLLSWSKIQEENYQTKCVNFELSETITHNINLLKETALTKGISINYENTKEYNIFADQNMISTVIRNLLNNAIKFTHPKGLISIQLEKIENEISVRIADNGIGMTEEQKENLFSADNFKIRTGTSNEKGSGLGLKLVYEFIKLNNGKISVESEEDKGTCFTIQLPAAKV
jgi:signal transduction histidine kinase